MDALQLTIGELMAEVYTLREENAELRAKTDNRKKLGRYDVYQLRKLAADGWTYDELGEYFDINPANAYRVATGKYYRNIK
jgi:hypothetical protein